MQLIIKVCGMREPSNIAKLQELEVDWMGMIFFKKSSRNVEQPIFIKKEIPRVGVFVNEEIDFIFKKITDYQLDFVQLHGDESADFCKKIKETSRSESRDHPTDCEKRDIVAARKRFTPSLTSRNPKDDGLVVSSPKKIIKVFSVGNDFDFSILKPYEAVVDYFLFDTKGENRGGNGVAFNWDILKKYNSEVPFLLSGGINSDSVEAIKNFQHPKMVGIDINSRFESEPALKDIQKIKTFIHELRSK
jgi:phosphoribosylanthranilate isomerase